MGWEVEEGLSHIINSVLLDFTLVSLWRIPPPLWELLISDNVVQRFLLFAACLLFLWLCLTDIIPIILFWGELEVLPGGAGRGSIGF